MGRTDERFLLGLQLFPLEAGQKLIELPKLTGETLNRVIVDVLDGESMARGDSRRFECLLETTTVRFDLLGDSGPAFFRLEIPLLGGTPTLLEDSKDGAKAVTAHALGIGSPSAAMNGVPFRGGAD